MKQLAESVSVAVALFTLITVQCVAGEKESGGTTSKVVRQSISFTFTSAEEEMVRQHREAFALRELKLKKDDGKTETIKAGSLMALWRDESTVVKGGDKIKIRWMIPQKSRRAFQDLIGANDREFFTLHTVARNGQIFTMHCIGVKDFKQSSGVVEVSSPPSSQVRGAADIYFYLWLKGLPEDQVATNILTIKVVYDD